MNKKIGFRFVIMTVFAISLAYAQPATKVNYLSAKDFQKEALISQNILIDIRTPEEYASGHIKDAKMIDFRQSNFAEQLKKLDHQKKTLIYCRSGRRTDASLLEFEKQSFKQIVILKGGIQSWSAAQLPFE